MILALALAAGFLLGLAVQQGSTCAVTATKEIVYEGRTHRMRGFVVLMALAGLTQILLVATVPDLVRIDAGLPVTSGLIVGGVLFGAGAIVNDACLFGSLARTGHGELRFLMILPGLAAGYLISGAFDLAGPRPEQAIGEVYLDERTGTIVAVLVTMAIVAAISLGKYRPAPRQLPIVVSMLLFGIAGAFLYALAPGWTYADVVRAEAVGIGGSWIDNLKGTGPLVAATMLSGVIVAGLISRTFTIQRPTLWTLVRSFVGGMMMAIAITFIPGGNDTLLLWSIPALTFSGITAYLAMTASVFVILGAMRLYQQRGTEL